MKNKSIAVFALFFLALCTSSFSQNSTQPISPNQNTPQRTIVTPGNEPLNNGEMMKQNGQNNQNDSLRRNGTGTNGNLNQPQRTNNTSKNYPMNKADSVKEIDRMRSIRDSLN